MYKLTFSLQAVRELKKVPKQTVHMIREKLELISADPYKPHSNVKKLQGRSGYRLRVGDWRVIYEIDQEEIVILVIKVARRSEVYK